MMKREPTRVTKSLEALRRGSAGTLRENVRCMLILLMGHRDCAAVPRGRKIPHWFPESGLTQKEKVETEQVARDVLLELGYDAAAEELGTMRYPSVATGARSALQILESGPPSLRIDTYLVFKKPLLRHAVAQRLIAKSVDLLSRPWMVFTDVTGHVRKFWGAYKTLAEAKREATRFVPTDVRGTWE